MKTIFAATVLLLACSGLAQTNLITFTNRTGEVFNHVKVVKVERDGIIYVATQGAGGGKIKFSDLPESLQKQFAAEPIAEPRTNAPAQIATGKFVMTKAQLRMTKSEYFGCRIDQVTGLVSQVIANGRQFGVTGLGTGIIREFKSGETNATYTFDFMLEDTHPTLHRLMASEPIIFLIDGKKYSFNDPRAHVTTFKDGADDVQSWMPYGPEEIVIALGQAKSATVRLPAVVPFDHTFTKVELDRFALFLKVYINRESD